MNLTHLAYRYLLGAQFCRWAASLGGHDKAVAEAERIVEKDMDNDLDFVVISVLHGQLEDLTTRSMVRGLEQLHISVPVPEAEEAVLG